jgi:hypothetical protein
VSPAVYTSEDTSGIVYLYRVLKTPESFIGFKDILEASVQMTLYLAMRRAYKSLSNNMREKKAVEILV